MKLAITAALAGAAIALAAPADAMPLPPAPTPVGPETNIDPNAGGTPPLDSVESYSQEYIAPGGGEFDAYVLSDKDIFGATDKLIYDPANGDQYNVFQYGSTGQYFDSFSGQDQAGYITPFGDMAASPTQADLGPSYWDPAIITELTPKAAELLDPSAFDLASLFDLGALLP